MTIQFSMTYTELRALRKASDEVFQQDRDTLEKYFDTPTRYWRFLVGMKKSSFDQSQKVCTIDRAELDQLRTVQAHYENLLCLLEDIRNAYPDVEFFDSWQAAVSRGAIDER